MYSRDVVARRAQEIAIDAFLLFCSALGAVWIRHGSGLFDMSMSPSTPWGLYLVPSLLGVIFVAVILHALGSYRIRKDLPAEALRIAQAVIGGITVLLAVSFFIRDSSYSRATVIIFFLLSVPLLTISRIAGHRIAGRLRTHGDAGRRVLVVGFGRIGRRLGEALLTDPAYYTLVGFVDDDPTVVSGAPPDTPILGTTAVLSEIIRSQNVDEVILAIPSATSERVQQLIGTCIKLNVRWKVVPNIYDLLYERIQLDLIGGLPVIGLRGSQIVGRNWATKRMFDVAAASTFLIILSPLILLITLLVKTTSRGPVLFHQTRVGLHGRNFTMFKFRSMRINNDPAIHQHYVADWILGATGSTEPEDIERGLDTNGSKRYKITSDPRITRIGRVIRATSLDELPQLLNVIRGDMSLVGPRPPLPYEVERYTTWHRRRLDVLPGITGLWQVSGRNRLSFEEMIQLDVEYIEEWALTTDLKIVWKTLPALFMNKGY